MHQWGTTYWIEKQIVLHCLYVMWSTYQIIIHAKLYILDTAYHMHCASPISKEKQIAFHYSCHMIWSTYHISNPWSLRTHIGKKKVCQNSIFLIQHITARYFYCVLFRRLMTDFSFRWNKNKVNQLLINRNIELQEGIQTVSVLLF